MNDQKETPETQSGEVLNMAGMNLSADRAKQALAAMRKEGKIGDEQENQLWWFFCHCKQEGYGWKEAGRQLGMDGSTIYRIYHLKYNAKIDNFCADVARYRKIVVERAAQVKLDFVETSTAKTIFRVCDGALITQTIALIYGDSQIGKTTALEEYARRNNHGQTKYLRTPASAGVQLFMKEFAKACFCSCKGSFEGMRDAVMNAIDDKTLVIIDEVHQCFLSYQKSSQVKVLELLREIYDRKKCGMVLVGTDIWRQELYEGSLARLLNQLRRRGTIHIQLPPRPTRGDIEKIARKFGLPPPDDTAMETIKDMLHQSGLGMYIKYIQNAARMAARSDDKLSWAHFIRAYDIMAKLSKMGEREE